MALISQIITANEAMKIAAQFVDLEHEYTINYVMSDIKKYAQNGKKFFSTIVANGSMNGSGRI